MNDTKLTREEAKYLIVLSASNQISESDLIVILYNNGYNLKDFSTDEFSTEIPILK